MSDDQLADLRYKVGSHLYFSGWVDSISKGESVFDSMYEAICRDYEIVRVSEWVSDDSDG